TRPRPDAERPPEGTGGRCSMPLRDVRKRVAPPAGQPDRGRRRPGRRQRLRAVVFVAGARFAALLRVAVVLRVAAVFLAAAFFAVAFLAVAVAGALAVVLLVLVALVALVAALAPAGAGGHVPFASFGAVLGLITASLKAFRAVMRAFFEALIRTGSPV